ncbi:MAG: DUF1569 domain-containing protein [Planctomycetaceae bacterium]
MAERRTLTFARLDQVMPDVDRLLEGHETAGRWSLGMICNHLGSAIQGSIAGFPGRAPWLVRKTIAPFAKRKVLRAGRMGEGVKVPEAYLPKPGLDARAEAEALRAALRLYAAHSDPLAEHPLFGRMSRDEWNRLHCIHCAHHLSFVHPA